MESETRERENQQAPEKETATGSGGLFGDLRHEKPEAVPEQGQDSFATATRPTHQAGQQIDQFTPAHVAGTQHSGHQHIREGLAEHSMSGGTQSPADRSSHSEPPTVEPPFSHAPPGQEPLLRPNLGVLSDPQPTAHASSSQQPLQQPTQDDNPADPDQLPPLREAQFAEEQDLVPDELDETDSALGSDTQSTTTTLSQSVFDYRKEHGRTYHAYKDGKYIFPNDEREADRLDLQHHLFRITFANQLFFAPLDKPKRCLDVGTGTGIWAIEFADEFPECQVVGIDLSPGQPMLVPPNLKFVIDDAEDMWIYPDKFDFIHARLMAGCFADWPNFFQQAYENLEPGGWLELQDYGLPVKSADGTADGTDLLRWGELLCEAGRKLGRPMGSDCADLYLTWMEEAGFVDIQQRMFMWPSNGWPKDPFMKELGRWNQMNILDGLEGFCLALLTRGLGWRKEEVDVFVARVSRDFRDRKIHAYFPMPVVFARKPMPGEVAFRG